MLSQELVPQDLTSLAASSHRVDIEVGKGLLGNLFRLVAVGEDRLVVFKHSLEKLILNILPPQRLSIVLLQMLDLISGVHLVGLRAAWRRLLALS